MSVPASLELVHFSIYPLQTAHFPRQSELGWNADPSKRPSFDFISEQLEDMTVFTPNIRPIGHQKKAGESNPHKAKRPTNNSTQANGTQSTTTSKRGFASWFS